MSELTNEENMKYGLDMGFINEADYQTMKVKK